MKKVFTSLVIILGFHGYLTCQFNDSTGLHLIVTNIKEAKGQLMIAVYDSAEFFLTDSVFVGFQVEITHEGDTPVRIPDLQPGHYAISIFHDKNRNEKLDKRKIIRVPKEPYGFSNNVRKKFRAPRFHEAAFEYTHGMQMQIRIK